MPYDPASFDAEQVQAVYPPGFRRCWLGSRSSVIDKGHTLGRGESFGIRLADPRRKILSSIYNLSWIGRDPHTSGFRDRDHIRAHLLDQADTEIRTAKRRGVYEDTEIDFEFWKLRDEWLRDTFKGFAFWVLNKDI